MCGFCLQLSTSGYLRSSGRTAGVLVLHTHTRARARTHTHTYILAHLRLGATVAGLPLSDLATLGIDAGACAELAEARRQDRRVSGRWLREEALPACTRRIGQAREARRYDQELDRLVEQAWQAQQAAERERARQRAERQRVREAMEAARRDAEERRWQRSRVDCDATSGATSNPKTMTSHRGPTPRRWPTVNISRPSAAKPGPKRMRRTTTMKMILIGIITPVIVMRGE